MARKLRKDRVAGALGILILLIVLICFVCFRSCKRSKNNNGGETQTTQSAEQTSSGELEKAWPSEIAEYVKEYKGAGEIVSVEKSTDDKGRTVFDIKYKGTSIESCFAYVKDTLGIKGEWTEVVTDEHYTFERDNEKYALELSCEPKAANGYDLLIKVRLK